MPWRAISIMPFDIRAPKRMPVAAIHMMTRYDETLAPTADERKFTASLLTPTKRSKIASMKRKMMIPR